MLPLMLSLAFAARPPAGSPAALLDHASFQLAEPEQLATVDPAPAVTAGRLFLVHLPEQVRPEAQHVTPQLWHGDAPLALLSYAPSTGCAVLWGRDAALPLYVGPAALSERISPDDRTALAAAQPAQPLPAGSPTLGPLSDLRGIEPTAKAWMQRCDPASPEAYEGLAP